MNKDNEIKLVGQPIFSQIVRLIERIDLKGIINKHNTNYYYKAFDGKTHLITLLFGILSRCDSITEICEGLRAMGGKLNQIGLTKSPAKSTVSDGMRNRDNRFFEEIYFSLVKHYQSFLSDSRTFGLTFKEVLLIDSTTIRLFSDVLKGVGRDPMNDGKKKGGLKVHMLIDAVQSIGKFIKITEARVHDKNFLEGLILAPYSMLVFDKAYNHYCQFAKWSGKHIYFVTRLKDNAVYTVQQLLFKQKKERNKAMVLREEIIEIIYDDENAIGKKTGYKRRLWLKKVCYQDEKNRYYEFLSNSMKSTAEEIAFLYKKRWAIELLFKKMKQNFQLHYFYGENENAIRTQVWCTLIAQLMLTVIQKIADTKKAFSVIATLIRINLISLLDLYELLRSTNRYYLKQRGSPGLYGQLSLNL